VAGVNWRTAVNSGDWGGIVGGGVTLALLGGMGPMGGPMPTELDPLGDGIPASSLAKDRLGDPDCPGCGYSLPDNDVVYQYQANPSNPKNPRFNDVPRPGESALSCQYGPACRNNPKQGLAQAFNGRSPKVGERYRWTTIGQIRSVGRTPIYDGGMGGNPVGHLSIYGTNDPEAFHSIWNGPVPFE